MLCSYINTYTVGFLTVCLIISFGNISVPAQRNTFRSYKTFTSMPDIKVSDTNTCGLQKKKLTNAKFKKKRLIWSIFFLKFEIIFCAVFLQK